MPIQLLSTHPDAKKKLWESFVVHKTFLKLHSETVLQHSSDPLRWMVDKSKSFKAHKSKTDLKICYLHP